MALVVSLQPLIILPHIASTPSELPHSHTWSNFSVGLRRLITFWSQLVNWGFYNYEGWFFKIEGFNRYISVLCKLANNIFFNKTSNVRKFSNTFIERQKLDIRYCIYEYFILNKDLFRFWTYGLDLFEPKHFVFLRLSMFLNSQQSFQNFLGNTNYSGKLWSYKDNNLY